MSEFKFPDEMDDAVNPSNEKADAGFEIEFVDDTPDEDKNRTPMPTELVKQLEVEVDDLDKYSKDAKEKMIQMKKVWNDERRDKEKALRERQEAEAAAQRLLEENRRMRELINNGEKEYLSAVKSSAELQLETAKKAYKDAYEAGDPDLLLAAQQQLNQITLQLDKINNYKRAPLQDENNVVKQPQQSNQVQAAPQPSQRAMSWQQENPWFGSDEEMTSLALGAHQKIVAAGVIPDSDQYYKMLNETMRRRFPEKFEGTAPAAKDDTPSKAKPSTVVAPATRSTAPKKVKLTLSQQALIKRLGLSPEQYVKEVLKMEI
ncbi:MAG: hypothetical protein KGI88_07990 [Betaproteobacteria bacterium]|nr:hypothetical protein [Betaproteobacteria bacterium]